ncbi:uncharacterized protein [Clytia hemisphaerica]|uniref:uncharacterized protein n=1 Tax=Clytia hemisphaerica TaxID=252671 RepID=UPI0034D3AB36
MSSYVTVAQAIQEIENWLRLATLLHEPLKGALLALLHNDYNDPNYVGLPRNSTALNIELRKQQSTINQLAKKGVLKKSQVDTLLPPNSNQTDSQTFDITLIIVLIINFTTLPPPKKGWKKALDPTDVSPAAFVLLARDWRNRLLHADGKSIDSVEFNLRWSEGENIVIGLGLTTYNFNALKNRPLDVTNNLVVQSLSFFSKKILNELSHVGADNIQLKKDMVTQNQEISNLDKNLNLHDTTLNEHGTTLGDHNTTLADHDTTLVDHDIVLEDHSDRLDDYATILANHKDFHQENKECILNLYHLVERLKEEHEFIKDNLPTLKEPGIYCTTEVLEIISNKIGEEKNQLLLRLGLSSNEDENLTDQLKTVEWSRLELELERLNGVDIINNIKQNTLVTEDIQSASLKLRCQYAKEVITSLVHEPLMGDKNQVNYQYDENLYTELAVLKATEVEKEINNSDRKALMEQRLLQKESIELHDLFQKEDEAVFVRAVGGMGKTTMLEMYTQKWAKRQLGLDFPMEFVFFFSCREINQIYDKLESIDDLFKIKYPDIFEKITLRDLEPVADKILVIIDGLDELQGVYDRSKNKSKMKVKSLTPFQIVFDLINTQGSILKGHKCIASGRPKACDFVKKEILELKISSRKVIKIKTVEVCGFKEEEVEQYIDKFFNENTEKAIRVKEIIRSSHNLKVMSTVPVFAWVICNVYSEDLITKPLNTYTELNMYACLVFLRKHLQGLCNKGYDNLLEMLDDANVIDCIYSLMTLSVKTYMKNQVLFSEEEVRQLKCPVHLEQTGLIVKYNRGEMREPIYQYKHLVLQEFLTGLHLYVTKGISPYLRNRELSSCAPVMFGIGRLLNENDVFIKFFRRLSDLHRSRSSMYGRFVQPFRSWRFERYLVKNSVVEIPDCMFGPDSLIVNSEIPECQEFMTTLYEGRMRVECPFSTVEIKCDLRGIDLRNVVFLVEHLNLKLKIPRCMQGVDSLIINTAIPECKQWVKFLRDSKLTSKDHLFAKADITFEVNFDFDLVSFLVQHLNLVLRLPRVMKSTNALVVNTRNTECIQFMKIVHRTRASVDCPYSYVKYPFSAGEAFLKPEDEQFIKDKLPSIIKRLNLKLKVPDCMIGSDVLIINTNSPECRYHINIAYDLQLQPVYPATSIEIHSQINRTDMRKIQYIIKASNLKLDIPSCMVSTDSIIINTNFPECRHHINVAYDLQLKPVYPMTSIEIHSQINQKNIEQIKYIIESSNLKLELPRSMVDTDSIIINTAIDACRELINFIYYSNYQVECPYSTASIQRLLMEGEPIKVASFINDMNLKLKRPNCLIGQNTLIIDMDTPEFKNLIALIGVDRNFVIVDSSFDKTAEVKSDIQLDYIEEVVYLLEKNNITTLKVPDCMKGGDTLLINKHHKECMGFLKLVTATSLKLDEDPFQKFEICSHLTSQDIRDMEASFTSTNIVKTDSSGKVTSVLKIPDKMVGLESLIIDMDVPECKWFLKFFHQSKTKPLCPLPFTVVEIQSVPLDSTIPLYYEQQIKFFMKFFSLKLKIPDVMIGSQGLVIELNNKDCVGFIRTVNSLQVEVDWPFAEAEKTVGMNSGSDERKIQFFINYLNSKAKLEYHK